MSDIDEPPPSKVSKIELSITPEDMAGSQDNGQEEWLSEGVLTDDGFDATEQVHMSNADNFSQDESMHSANGTASDTAPLEQSMGQDVAQDPTQLETTLDQTLEAHVQRLSEARAPDRSQDDGSQLDSISEYLVKKPREERDSEGEEPDDGNNTDELLEMLGEENKLMKKKQVLKKMSERQTRAQLEASSDDEDLDSLEAMVRQGGRVTRLKTVQNALVRKYPPKKAVPEGMSDSEMSTDEAETMKHMFKPRQATGTKSTTKPSSQASKPKSLPRPGVAAAAGKSANSGKANTSKTNTGSSKPLNTSTPLRQYTNRNALRASSKKETPKSESPKVEAQKAESQKVRETKKVVKNVSPMEEPLDSNEDAEWDGPLQLRRPEQMDEDMFSEDDSEFDDDDCSLYNELPSSDSEDVEEWFALDVRAERAGDYIPLLGNKAFELLTEERKRVEGKLSNLRASITDLAERRKQQTAQVEAARRTLSELDTLLAHA